MEGSIEKAPATAHPPLYVFCGSSVIQQISAVKPTAVHTGLRRKMRKNKKMPQTLRALAKIFTIFTSPSVEDSVKAWKRQDGRGWAHNPSLQCLALTIGLQEWSAEFT